MTLWVFFILAIGILLALDLASHHKNTQELPIKAALLRCTFWVGLALAFNVFVYYWHGAEAALQFLTAYLIEESLSVDNLFVFLMIFSYFGVPARVQPSILFWGILGAVVMRMIFIVVGVSLLERFHWMVYLFGAFLVWTGYKMAAGQEAQIDLQNHPFIRWIKKWVPISEEDQSGAFFVVKNGRRMATRAFVVLLVVEGSDLMFAMDSIPAVLAISSDPFIIYTSNVFAILGLRSLYFAIAGVMQLFHYLHYGLSVILIFVGFKMLVSRIYEVPIAFSLGIIFAILCASIYASLRYPKQADTDPKS